MHFARFGYLYLGIKHTAILILSRVSRSMHDRGWGNPYYSSATMGWLSAPVY